MGVISEIVGNEASGFSLSHKGQVYTARLINQTVKSDWERWLFERDLAKHDATRKYRSDEENATRLEAMERAFDEGEYEFFSERGLDALRRKHGVMKISSLIFQRDFGEILGLLSERKAEVLRLIMRVVRLSFPGLDLRDVDLSETADPNAPRPAPSND